MENSVKDIIRQWKSVRTFNGAVLRKEDRQKLEQYLETLDNPFDVLVKFRFLDAKEYELSSPVIIGTDLYIAAKVSRIPQSEIAYPVGYPAEKRSVRETLMRKGLKADERLSFGELFFEGSFAESLTPEHAGQFRDALEMVRIALAHFDLTLKETGTDGRFMSEDPGFKIDDGMEYIITYGVKY